MLSSNADLVVLREPSPAGPANAWGMLTNGSPKATSCVLTVR